MTKYSQKSLIAKVERTILENGLIAKDEVVIVGLSGGADSVCLFEILNILKDRIGFHLLAAHFNHRLRGEESDGDQKFVEDLCTSKGISLEVGYANNVNDLKSEESARNARYDFFEHVLDSKKGDKFALAHHANDVAETFLMRLVRGGGLKGLSSIKISRDRYIRPLLFIEKDEISQFLGENEIKYRDDSSNLSEDFLRNKFRLSIIPQLETINPQIIENLSVLSSQINEDYNYLLQMAQKSLDDIVEVQGNEEIILNRRKWLELHLSMQKMVLRLAFDQINSLKNITNSHLEDVCLMIKKGEGKKQKRLPNSLLISYQAGKITISNKIIS